MSMHSPGGRSRQTIIRQLAQQAAAHPRIESAVMGAIRAELPGVIEDLLRQAYGGSQLRVYIPQGSSQATKGERDRRIHALATAPANLSPQAIAAQEGISVRRVQQILARRLQP